MRRRLADMSNTLDILDAEGPINQIAGQAGAGPAVLRTILQGLNLNREADRQRLDAEIQRLFFLNQRGGIGRSLEGMDPEDFQNILLNWERLLDEQRENERREAEAREQDRQRTAAEAERAREEARREAERRAEEHRRFLQELERQRLDAIRAAEQAQVDRRLAEEEAAELRDLQRRAGVLGGDPASAMERVMKLMAEAQRLASGPLGEDSPLARDARRRADEALREAIRLIEAGERTVDDILDPGFTVQRTVTEVSANRLHSELQLQTHEQRQQTALLRSINAALQSGLAVAITGGPGGSVVQSLPADWAARLDQDLAARYQDQAVLSGNATLPS
jgi:hypothetical protein